MVVPMQTSARNRRILGILDRFALVAFAAEVRRQCAYGELAASDIERALEEQDADRLWSGIHSFLIAVGNVSKLLWPEVGRRGAEKPGQRPRGLIMRAVLSVPEDSPLKLREFRDIWEHYDKYLDRWAALTRTETPLADFIGPISSFPESKRFARTFSPDHWVVGLDARSYHLRPPLEALKRLRQVAESEGYELASGTFDLDKVERGVKAKLNDLSARRRASRSRS
jgi:hypothetical protein